MNIISKEGRIFINRIDNYKLTNSQFAQLAHNTFDYWKSAIAQFERFEISFHKDSFKKENDFEVTIIGERLYLIISIYMSLKYLETLVKIIEDTEVLNKIQGIDKLKEVEQDMRKAIDYKEIQKLRNHTFHEIEYLLNIGHDQRNLDIEESKNLSFSAMWTVEINKSGIYIFGINISNLIEKFRENFPVIDSWCNQIKYLKIIEA